jgi:hypothetical protein
MINYFNNDVNYATIDDSTYLDSHTVSALESYGWHVENEAVIEVGDDVYFYDDESEQWNFGTYCGWYEDWNDDGDTSPYMNEAFEGIDRLVIQEVITNPDGSPCVRRNYALPENVFDAPKPYNIVIAEWFMDLAS